VELAASLQTDRMMERVGLVPMAAVAAAAAQLALEILSVALAVTAPNGTLLTVLAAVVAAAA
jgi:hypothetical protein